MIHVVQQKILRLIETYDVGKMSLRDIGKIVGEEHPQMIKHHLEQLEKRGLIKWNKEKKIINKTNTGVISNSDFIVVPVLGASNCGDVTIFATEFIEGHIKVSTGLLKNKLRVFAVKAIGSSMDGSNIDGKNIEDGDYVIIDPNDKNINDNDYVLSIIDGTVNIKKITFDRDHNQIMLFSESTNFYPSIYLNISEASKYLVDGKIIQVIKVAKASK
jgi:SOS-response transcriptional repressor LexA